MSKQNIFKVVYDEEQNKDTAKSFACKVCGKEIKTEYNLKIHEEACKKKNESRRNCPICGKSKTIGTWEEHVNACKKTVERNKKKALEMKEKRTEEKKNEEKKQLAPKKIYLPQILMNFIAFICKAIEKYNAHVDIYNYVDHPGSTNFYYIGDETGKPDELSTAKIFEYLSAISQNRPKSEYFKSMKGLEIKEFLNRMLYYGLTTEKKQQIGIIIAEKKLENIKKSGEEPTDILGEKIIEIMSLKPYDKLKLSVIEIIRTAFKQLPFIIMSNNFFLRPKTPEEKKKVYERFQSYLPEIEKILIKEYPEDVTFEEIKSEGDIVKEKLNMIWDNDHCGQYAFSFFVGSIISYFYDGGRNDYMCHFCCNYFMRPENHFFKYQCPDIKALVKTGGFNNLLIAIQKQLEFMGLYKDVHEALEVAKKYKDSKPHIILKKVYSWMNGEKEPEPPKENPKTEEKTTFSHAQDVINATREWYGKGWIYQPFEYNTPDGIYLEENDEFNGIKLLEKISSLEGKDLYEYGRTKLTPHNFIRQLWQKKTGMVPMEVEEDIKEEKPIKKKLEKGKTILLHKKFEEDNQISSGQEIKVLSDLPADTILVNKTDDEGKKKTTKPKQENVSDQLLPETIKTGEILYKKKEENKHKFFGNDVQLVTRIDRNTLIKQIAGYNKYLIWGKIQEKDALKELELLMNAYTKGKDYSREALALYTAVFGDITQTSPDIINLKNEIRQLKMDAKKYIQQQITTRNVEMVKGLKTMVEIAESEIKKKSEELLNLESLAREEELRQKTVLIKKIIDLKTWLLRGEREETGEGKSDSELRTYLESLQEREHREFLNISILGYQLF